MFMMTNIALNGGINSDIRYFERFWRRNPYILRCSGLTYELREAGSAPYGGFDYA